MEPTASKLIQSCLLTFLDQLFAHQYFANIGVLIGTFCTTLLIHEILLKLLVCQTDALLSRCWDSSHKGRC